MAVTAVATDSRRRGRPKGSGIDDHTRLVEIRSYLQRDDALTPTAAIRAAGIVDPSTIRRLRNKLALPALPNAPANAPKIAQAPRSRSQPAPQNDVPQTVRSSPDARQREADLLAAYLHALSKPAPPPEPPLPDTPGRPAATAPSQPPPVEPPKPARAAEEAAKPQSAPSTPFPWPMPFPGFPQMPGMPPMPGMTGAQPFPFATPFGSPFTGPIAGAAPGPFAGMSIPGMPSFLQPFQTKSSAPAATGAVRQLETFKLAIEAMTAIARFQLHLIENAPAYTPMALMLQGQTFIGQMMMASLTGQMDAMRRTSQPSS